MIKRLITGICLVGAVSGFFFLRKLDTAYFQILVLLIAVIGSYEFTRALGEKITSPQKYLVIIYSLLFVPSYFLWAFKGLAALYFVVCIVLLSLLVIDANTTIENTGISFFAVFYPSLLLAPILMANSLSSNSTLALLLIFIIAPASDTFAYAVGCTVKGKKLCPSISPKKTISGAVGGLFGGALGSLLLYFIFKDSFVYQGAIPEVALFIIIGIVGSALTIFGDLAESVIKRKLGVKDMGKILPGHGGILDRIDGIMFAAAFIFACFYFIA